jgi:hypothetical protein
MSRPRPFGPHFREKEGAVGLTAARIPIPAILQRGASERLQQIGTQTFELCCWNCYCISRLIDIMVRLPSR